MPPLLALVTLTAGVALGALVLRALAHTSFTIAAAATAVVVLVVPLAATFGDRLYGIDLQRRTLSTVIEREAREKCLADLSRPDAEGYLAFVRAHVPKDATYAVRPSDLRPCLALNLLPRTPVPSGRVDAARDWLVFDGTIPAAYARDPRRLRYSPTQVLVPPSGP